MRRDDLVLRRPLHKKLLRHGGRQHAESLVRDIEREEENGLLREGMVHAHALAEEVDVLRRDEREVVRLAAVRREERDERVLEEQRAHLPLVRVQGAAVGEEGTHIFKSMTTRERLAQPSLHHLLDLLRLLVRTLEVEEVLEGEEAVHALDAQHDDEQLVQLLVVVRAGEAESGVHQTVHDRVENRHVGGTARHPVFDRLSVLGAVLVVLAATQLLHRPEVRDDGNHERPHLLALEVRRQTLVLHVTTTACAYVEGPLQHVLQGEIAVTCLQLAFDGRPLAGERGELALAQHVEEQRHFGVESLVADGAGEGVAETAREECLDGGGAGDARLPNRVVVDWDARGTLDRANGGLQEADELPPVLVVVAATHHTTEAENELAHVHLRVRRRHEHDGKGASARSEVLNHPHALIKELLSPHVAELRHQSLHHSEGVHDDV